MKRLTLACLALALLWPVAANGQGRRKLTFDGAVQSIKGEIEPRQAHPGQTVTYKLIVELNPGHHTYPTRQPDQREKDSQNTIALPEGTDLIFVAPVTDPPNPITKPGTKAGQTLAYYEDTVTWEFKAVVSPKATPGPKTIPLKQFKILVCDDEGCLPPRDKTVEASLTVAGLPVEPEPKYREIVARAIGSEPPNPVPPRSVGVEPPAPRGGPPTAAPPKVESKGAGTPPAQGPDAEAPKVVPNRLSADRDYAADLKAVKDQLPPPEESDTGFWAFVATAAVWGFLTLLTPCVFPMIPITVSIFVKQSEKQGTNVLALALVYALTIVVLMSVAAMTVLSFFSRLAVDPTTNVVLGLLFVALALSLFGLFELTLPSSLATALDNRASRGGYVGTVFMAASFTVVSFTCVAPFLGGFGGVTAAGKSIDAKLAAGAITFAAAFASPFFLLALFPSLIKKLPKSGDWMNMVKVTMGFLELAAALKFFRTAELRWVTPPEYFTYDFVLALWVAILVAMALYLFGVFRTRHDHEMHDHVGPWRILFALAALGLAVYLLPALFNSGPKDRNRPHGTVYAWVDSFLLPEPSAAEVVGSDLPWSPDLRRALDDARAKGGRVFVDFTGVTCTNCKLNERDVFTKPEVKELLRRYTLVQLYTDTVPDYYYDSPPGLARQNADARLNFNFEIDAFGVESLPSYVILKPEPNGKVSLLYKSADRKYWEGLIKDEPAFVDFLKNGLK